MPLGELRTGRLRFHTWPDRNQKSRESVPFNTKNPMSDLLIHIGYHKTASTWLQKELFSRRQAGFGRLRNLRRTVHAPHALDFDPKRCYAHFHNPLKRIRGRRLMPVLSHERLSGSPHSGGYDSKEIADRLATLFPESRILIVIREQQSAILSCYKQYVRVGGAGRLKQYVVAPSRGQFRIPLFSFDFFAYDRLIRYYIQLYGASRVLVLPFELFQHSPRQFIERIMAFSGAVPQSGVVATLPYHRKENPSKDAVSVCLSRLCNLIAGDDSVNPIALIRSVRAAKMLRRGADVFGGLAANSMQSRIERRWREQIGMWVGNRYAESNAATTRLTGLDLAEFGYDVKRDAMRSTHQEQEKAA